MPLGKARIAGSLIALVVATGCRQQTATDDDTTGGNTVSLPDGGSQSATPLTQHDINQILSTGQSLSVGHDGGSALSLTQPYQNVMFPEGVIPGGSPTPRFVPLVEGQATNPASPDVETMSSGLANLITKMALDMNQQHVVLMSVHGVSGYSYDQLKKGTPPYANGMAQATAGHQAAAALGKNHVVRAVTVVHGETDDLNLNANYQANIRQWQADYENDVKAITGQSEPVPMIHSQLSSFAKENLTSAVAMAQLAEHVASNGKTVLIGPKYQLEYATDGQHLTDDAYRRMGEEYAKVYKKIVLEGQHWDPLRPDTVTRSGNVITAKFIVPVPPIQLDTNTISNPGAFGFEFYEDGETPPQITNVSVTGSDTVQITLATAPNGSNQRLRYAYTAQGVGAYAGPLNGPRGNLRDSDPTESRYGGNPLWNWCVHFDQAITQ